jgi:Ca2+/H+ antiporter
MVWGGKRGGVVVVELEHTRELSRFAMARMATILVMASVVVSFVAVSLLLQGLCMVWPAAGWRPRMARRERTRNPGMSCMMSFFSHFEELWKR